MSDVCGCPPEADAATSEAKPLEAVPCPTNGQVGQAVDLITLKALLAVPLTEVRPVGYRFCRAPDCPTVYYSLDGGQVFGEAALREKVYQKHVQEADTLICYCFRHTLGGLRAEIERTGQSTVVAQIVAGIQAGACACDLRNPQGSCCLGNVRQWVVQIKNEASRA